MDNLFLFIFLLSPILLIIGLIKPSIFASRLPAADLSRKRLALVFITLFFTSIVGFGYTAPDAEDNKENNQNETLGEQSQVSSLDQKKGDTAKVVRVIDGDTIELENGQKVRYIGIDSPESDDPSKPSECFAQESTRANKEIVEGKTVILEKDVSETDQFGRLLRYVWIEGFFVNEYLVKEGYASAGTYPPDVKYQDKFSEAEKFAKENKKGLWVSVCDTSPTPSPEVQSAQTQDTNVQPSLTATPRPSSPTSTPYVAPTNPPLPSSSSGNYSCAFEKTCGQMTSCDEAYYHLNVCGYQKRDGDNDGVPCESICPGG